MPRQRVIGPLRAEYCEGGEQGGYWLPNFFGAVGRLNFGWGDVAGLRIGFGGGRWLLFVTPAVRKRAVAIAWERRA
jgi:hypothetical protein